MNEPNVVVVVLNWNRGEDTIACVGSLLDLSYNNYDILVVDNASTDDSVRRIARALPDIEILETTHNLGFSGGNNVGIREALTREADYVWLLNNDTVVHLDALQHMVGVAETDPSIGAVGCVIYDMDRPDRVQAWGGARVTPVTGRALEHRSPPSRANLHYLVGASILLRREAVEGIGLLDEGYFMYWDDVDLGFRLRQAGWLLAIAEHAEIWHKEKTLLGKSNPRLDAIFSTSAVRFYRHHFRFFLVPLILNVAARSLRRLLAGDLERTAAVWKGTWAGMTQPSVQPPRSGR